MSRDARAKRTSAQNGFDGASVGDAEDVDGEDDAHSRPPSVLWEKHIEQSIFVDISDDDSLHFSDLQGAFTVHLSQGSGTPESLHLTDNAGPSESYETEDGSSETAESVSRDCVEHSNTKNRKENLMKPVNRKHEDDAVNTSDEEHEELPFDGAHTNNKTCHDGHETNLKSSPSCEMVCMTPGQAFSLLDKLPNTNVEETEVFPSNLAYSPSEDKGKCHSTNHKAIENVAHPLATSIQATAHISDFLLRHFSQEELLNSSRIIEAETLPEVSLMDSIDETVLSRACASQISSGEREKIQDIKEEPDVNTVESHELLELTLPERGMQDAASHCSNRNVSNESSSSKESGRTCIDDTTSNPGDDEEEECPRQNCSASSLDLSTAVTQKHKISFSRTRSFGELKYGQGQVHYPLPDFSKVASKVKIPKANGTVKPISQSPAMARTQSSPGILGKSTTSCKATVDVISRVLEDSIMPSERHNVFTDKEEQAGLAHQLQAEYDRLLAKYTEAENLIGQVRLKKSNWWIVHVAIFYELSPSEEQFSQMQNSLPVQTEPQSPTDGERLTSELRDIISSFMQKVDDFKTHVSTMSMNVEEQQMVLKSMMEAQDQLERNYLTKREEHRALEMQNYMGLARNTGEFDPDRDVEGQIFRIGMQLEDIKEQIDKNICYLFYPPPLTSTPSPSPCKDILFSSSHPLLHEESVICISAVGQNMEENYIEEDFEAAYEENKAESSFHLQYSTLSTETPGTANEDKQGRLTLTGEEQHQQSNSTSLKQQLTHDRYEDNIRPSEVSFSSIRVHYIRPSAENSPQPITDTKQRFLSPETDSGFGSSDLSRPNTGLTETLLNPLSSTLSNDFISVASMSGSDSAASHSNTTTISMAIQPVQPTVNMEYKQLDTTAVDTKINYITQNAPVRVPKQEDATALVREIHRVPVGGAIPIHDHRRGNVHLGKSHYANEKPVRDTHSPSHCSCHNEVILALQYEVSRLKRALEESLGHLPHMSKRTDYLNARYPSERKHRTQARGQNRAGSSRRVKTDASLQRTEDWISSDMEQITGGEDSDQTMSFQRAFSPPHQQIRIHFRSLSDKRSRDSRSSSKGLVGSFPLETSQISQSGSHRRASVGPAIHSGNANTGASYKSASSSPEMGDLGNVFLKSTKQPLSLAAQPCHKPLLQVNYGSSSSLPAGFKVRDMESEPSVSSRRRSTQSDSALLPSNVFFQRASPRTSRRKHRTSREESIHKTLDKALQAALLMKQTTDRMADALSADLAKTELHRKLHGLHPLSSRTGS
ncbi:uncharacterized protein LOC127441216 [Myxocyprinus asiaticus]|uniref:uncharacterized protein LOC127441216 n=1 Tax=Myxocyprinus asiaticus TaxID=70543 RepID=UPI002222C41A|nr:uncharacterized protein LOC127441216 [Myxocyprinus asiaticus]